MNRIWSTKTQVHIQIINSLTNPSPKYIPFKILKLLEIHIWVWIHTKAKDKSFYYYNQLICILDVLHSHDNSLVFIRTILQWIFIQCHLSVLWQVHFLSWNRHVGLLALWCIWMIIRIVMVFIEMQEVPRNRLCQLHPLSISLWFIIYHQMRVCDSMRWPSNSVCQGSGSTSHSCPYCHGNKV